MSFREHLYRELRYHGWIGLPYFLCLSLSNFLLFQCHTLEPDFLAHVVWFESLETFQFALRKFNTTVPAASCFCPPSRGGSDSLHGGSLSIAGLFAGRRSADNFRISFFQARIQSAIIVVRVQLVAFADQAIVDMTSVDGRLPIFFGSGRACSGAGWSSCWYAS